MKVSGIKYKRPLVLEKKIMLTSNRYFKSVKCDCRGGSLNKGLVHKGKGLSWVPSTYAYIEFEHGTLCLL